MNGKRIPTDGFTGFRFIMGWTLMWPLVLPTLVAIAEVATNKVVR